MTYRLAPCKAACALWSQGFGEIHTAERRPTGGTVSTCRDTCVWGGSRPRQWFRTDRFQIRSRELKSARLHVLLLLCCWALVINGHLLVRATKTHIDTHTIQCAHTPLNASSAAAASIVIDFPALMVEALMFKMPDSIGDPGTRNN